MLEGPNGSERMDAPQEAAHPFTLVGCRELWPASAAAFEHRESIGFMLEQRLPIENHRRHNGYFGSREL